MSIPLANVCKMLSKYRNLDFRAQFAVWKALAFALISLATPLAFATPVNHSAHENVTVNVPSGSQYIATEHSLCTPSTWKSIIVFYLANYFAHAATVKSMPGQTVLLGFASQLFALLFPMSGMLRAFDAILQHPITSKTYLNAASKSGALCVVVRTPTWKPEDGHHVEGLCFSHIFSKPQFALFTETRVVSDMNDSQGNAGSRGAVKMSSKQQQEILHTAQRTLVSERHDLGEQDKSSILRALNRQRDHQPGTLVDLPIVGVEKRLPGRVDYFLPASGELGLRHRKVHGVCCLPPGYALNMLPRGTEVTPFLNSQAALANKRNAISRGPKLDENHKEVFRAENISWSYSFSKALIALLQAVYASSTLYDARGDQIARFGFAAFGLTVTPYLVMSLINLFSNAISPDFPAVYLVRNSIMDEAAARNGGLFQGVVGHVRESYGDHTIKGLFKIERSGRTTLEVISGQFAHTSGWKNVADYRIDPMEVTISDQSTPTITVPGSPAVEDVFSKRRLHRAFAVGCCLLTASVVIGIIAGLSHFASGQSSLSQRIWIGLWFGTGMLMGILEHGLSLGWELEDDAVRASWVTTCYLLLVWGTPAIGGFVVVGQMLKTYGSCTQLY